MYDLPNKAYNMRIYGKLKTGREKRESFHASGPGYTDNTDAQYVNILLLFCCRSSVMDHYQTITKYSVVCKGSNNYKTALISLFVFNMPDFDLKCSIKCLFVRCFCPREPYRHGCLKCKNKNVKIKHVSASTYPGNGRRYVWWAMPTPRALHQVCLNLRK